MGHWTIRLSYNTELGRQIDQGQFVKEEDFASINHHRHFPVISKIETLLFFNSRREKLEKHRSLWCDYVPYILHDFVVYFYFFSLLLGVVYFYWHQFLIVLSTLTIYIKQVHLYGTSLGGLLAQLFAQHRPRRVRSLVLSNTFLETHDFAAAMPWAPVYVFSYPRSLVWWPGDKYFAIVAEGAKWLLYVLLLGLFFFGMLAVCFTPKRDGSVTTTLTTGSDDQQCQRSGHKPRTWTKQHT